MIDEHTKQIIENHKKRFPNGTDPLTTISYTSGYTDGYNQAIEDAAKAISLRDSGDDRYVELIVDKTSITDLKIK